LPLQIILNMHGDLMNSPTGTLFAIKHYAIHDGPNIRTTVFLKGCPLACIWCHNPEGLNEEIEVVTTADRCIGCGSCVEACAAQALSLSSGGIIRDTDRCTVAGDCVKVCPALAHEATGWEMDVPTLLNELKKDLPFYKQSGGGVTFSGGEPLQQADFLLAMLRACRTAGIHCAVDTCGLAPTETLLKVVEFTDLFLFDLKQMDSQIHQHFTGKSNEQILENITTVAKRGMALRIRLPLIPGINSDDSNLHATAAFVAALPGVDEIDLLPYQSAAKIKYARLGLTNLGNDLVPPTAAEKDRAINIFTEHGLRVRLGG
jgi:pyruvate formate lyase activating enzyme